MLSTCFIIDVSQNFFIEWVWNRISHNYLKEISPLREIKVFSGDSLSRKVRETIEKGWKKIIFIGTQKTIKEGVETIMEFTSAERKKLEIGLWPIEFSEISSLLLHLPGVLDSSLRVFKNNNTCPIDVGKIEWIDCKGKKHRNYFWRQCSISRNKESLDATIFTNDFLGHYFEPFPLSIQLGEQELEGNILGQLNIRLHLSIPHSLRLTPLDLMMSRFTVDTGYNASFLTRYITDIWRKKQKKEIFFSLRNPVGCNTLQVQSQKNLINLKIENSSHRCQTAKMELIHQAFPLLVPLIPYHRPKPASDLVLSFPSKNVVAKPQGFQSNGNNTGKK